MKSCFTPTVALRNRLTYPRKFGLIGLQFTLPLGVDTFCLIGELNDRIPLSAMLEPLVKRSVVATPASPELPQ